MKINVNYGHPKHGVPIYVITLTKTEYGSKLVEVFPCNTFGDPVSDAVAWDIFPDWLSAILYMRKQYKEFREYVNGRV